MRPVISKKYQNIENKMITCYNKNKKGAREMNIKVLTNISNEYQDIEIVINSPVKNEQVRRLENNLISESTKSMLPKNEFIRISNSAIININNVKCFNTSIVGKMIVKFEDGSEETVSRRRTSEIMKFLNERCE